MSGCSCSEGPNQRWEEEEDGNMSSGLSLSSVAMGNLDMGGSGNLGVSSGMRFSNPRKVRIIQLCVERQFQTQGNTPANTKYFVVGPKILEGLGVLTEDIVVHSRGKDFTAQFQYRVTARGSIDGDGWKTFSASIQPDTATQDQVVSNAYATRTDFGINLHFILGVSNVSGTAIESGNVTAFAAVKLWT